MTSDNNRKGYLQKIGLKHHEYWSWWILVIPVWPLWIWYAFRLRCATWFTAVNPGMEDSGFIGESKIKILDAIPHEYKPATLFIPQSINLSSIEKNISNLGMGFPLICKPDIGGRGRKVEIISDSDALRNYHESIREDYIIQSIIPFESEYGVFYVRKPNESQGRVISLAAKEFLKVKGNGFDSIEVLMKGNYRASLQITRLQNQLDLSRIPEKDEIVLLEPIGNHCRGTAFVNCNHLINEKLSRVFDHISNQITGFYYGRFDLKVKSLDDLYEGRNIQIMELNGLTADAAHIFDSSYRLRDAMATQFYHCSIAYQIASQNLKAGAGYTPLTVLIQKCRKYFNM